MSKTLSYAFPLAFIVVGGLGLLSAGWILYDRLTAPEPSNPCPPPAIEVRVPRGIDIERVMLTATTKSGCTPMVEWDIGDTHIKPLRSHE